MDDRQLIMNLYADNRTQARHHEVLRATGSTLIAAGAAALLTAVMQDQSLSGPGLPLAIFMMVIGIFGVIFCGKEYERIRLHVDRADVLLRILDQSDTTFNLVAVRDNADKLHGRRFPIFYRLRLNLLWLVLHFLIFVCGLVLTALILQRSGIKLDVIREFMMRL